MDLYGEAVGPRGGCDGFQFVRGQCGNPRLGRLAGKASGAEQATLRLLLRDLGRLIGLFAPGDGHDTSAVAAPSDQTLDAVMSLVLELRQTVRANRDFKTADLIRDRLKAAGITVKDGKDGATWER